MRSLPFFLILLFICSTDALATSWFLNPDQFLQLSNSDKQSYLRSVQSIVANLEAFQNNQYSAIQESSSNRTPASTDRRAEIQSELQSLKRQIDQAQASNQTSARDLADIFFLASRIRMRIDTFPRNNGQSALLGSWNIQFRRISALATKPEDKRKFQYLSALDTRLKQGRVTTSERASLLQQSGFPVRYRVVYGENPAVSSFQDLSLDTRRGGASPSTQQVSRTRQSNNVLSGGPPPVASTATRSSSAISSRPTSLSYTDVTSARPQRVLARTSPPQPQNERCIYAGFVIYGVECKHPTEIPSELNISSLDKHQYKCDNHQALCNPLLFGGNVLCTPEVLQSEMLKTSELSSCLKNSTGLCVDRSPTATTSCRELTKGNPQFLNLASLLVSKESQAWEIYVKKFENLCVKQNTSNQDIIDTCLVASYQLKELKESYVKNQLGPSLHSPAPPSTQTN